MIHVLLRALLFVYDLLWILLSPLVLCLLLTRVDSRRRLLQYLGFPAPAALAVADRAPHGVLLVHAVSVGEVLSAVPVVRLLRETFDVPVVLATTIDDAEVVSSKAPGAYDATTFCPLDFGPAVRTYLDYLRPVAVVVSETDLWPNFLVACAEREIPLYLSNGRISDKIRWGAGLAGPLASEALLAFRRLFVQTDRDRDALLDLGLPPGRVVVAGNTKYEGAASVVAPPPATEVLLEALRTAGRPVVVAASTHEGEEALLLAALRSAERRPTLVIAPRAIARGAAVADLCRGEGRSPALWSALAAKAEGFDARFDTLIVDVMGELRHVYAVADAVFVGGTFTPDGGHNFLEACAHAKAVVVGPDTHNFHADVALFLNGSALQQVATPKALEEALGRLLAHPEGARSQGERARRLLESQRGAAALVAGAIAEELAATVKPRARREEGVGVTG